MFQQTIKNFNIHFNALNERNSFSSGDLITGQISFDLKKPTKFDLITVTLTGKANIQWHNPGKGATRKQCSAKLEFFKTTSVIEQQNVAIGEKAKLQPGAHVFRFSCLLPHGDYPSSFSGDNGKIVYSMTVAINRSWHVSKDFVTDLNFVSRIDANQPELWAPLSGSNKMTLCSLWCAWGPITMTATAEKKAFNPGETAKIICDFSNASSRTATPKVKLQQKQSYYSNDRDAQYILMKTLTSLTGELISAHTSDVHTEFMLVIPSSAGHTISNCSILQVDYIIKVALSVTASHDLIVLIPIILCDTPVNTYPQVISE